MNRKSRKSSLFLAALGVSLVVPAAFGQTVNWAGNNSGDWNDGGNWSPNGVPNSSNIADFNGGGNGNTNITLDGNAEPIGAIEFDSSSAAGYTLGVSSGDAFTIGNATISSSIGAIGMTSGVTSSQAINGNVSFTTSAIPLISNASGSASLTLGSSPGSATLGLASVSSTTGLSISFSNSSTVVANDVITGIGGSTTVGGVGTSGTFTGGLMLTGTGTLILNAQNTYSGITDLKNSSGSVTIYVGSSTDTNNSATFTKGPFGTSTITPANSNQTFIAAYSADQTVANPMNLIFGFTASDVSIANPTSNHNLTFAGPIGFSTGSGRTITDNTYGQTLTLGAAPNSSTFTFYSTAASGSAYGITFDPGAGTLSSNTFPSSATLVLNDIIQDNGTPSIPDVVNYNSVGNNTPMGIVQINGANTYAGNTTINGQTSGFVQGITVQVGVSSVGAGSLVTSGPFGKGTLTWNGNSGGPGFLEPFGGDQTVGNNITMTSGFEVSEPLAAQDPTVATAPHNLTLSGNITLGTTSRVLTNNLPSGVAFTMGSSASPAILSLSSLLKLQTQAATGGGVTVINDAIQDGTKPGSLTAQSNVIVQLNNTNTYTGGTTATGGAQLTTATNLSNGTLSVTTGGKATVSAQSTPGATAGVTVVPALTVDSASKLDLTNNGLIVQSNTSFSTIQTDIINGAASGFTGNGITSSFAAAVAADSGNTHKTAIGYASVSELGNPSTFLGVSITDSNSTLVRYTLAGDSNMDGTVNALDFNALATHYGTTSGGDWVQGDYNYDGSVDSNDFDLLAANYNDTIANAATSSQPAVAALGAVVPEPTTIGLVGLSLLALRRRRGK